VTNTSDTFALAFRLHQSGNISQAEQLYRLVLQSDPRHADAYHMLGVALCQAGRLQEAVTAIRHALSLSPRAGVFYANLGVALEALGQMDEAINSYREAIRLRPEDADAHYNLGNVLRVQKNWNEARDHYGEAIRLKPDYAKAYSNLGLTLAAQGKLEEAVVHYRQALQLRPDSFETQNNLGVALLDLGRLEEAAACERVALRLNPDFPHAHHNLGDALLRLNQLDLAVASYRQALRLNPKFVEAWNNLGNALQRQDMLTEASKCYREALRINPAFAEAANNLGTVLQKQKQYDEAIRLHRQALHQNPYFAEAWNNLGSAFQLQDQLDEAIGCYQQAVWLKPDYADAWNHLGNLHCEQSRFGDALASYDQGLKCRDDLGEMHFNRARLNLLLGNWEQGWPEYEWRWQTIAFVPRVFREPRWDGSPLGEKSLLVYTEQGLGDTVHFCRYLPLVKQRVGKLILQCQPKLLPLLTCIRQVDCLVAQSAQPPLFDAQLPITSLPGIMQTDLGTVPNAVPYLHADPALIKRWKSAKCGLPSAVSSTSSTPHSALRTPYFLIGIAWQGNPAFFADRHRSVPLRHFAPLAEVQGIQLISLQKGPGTDQLQVKCGVRSAECGVQSLQDTLSRLRSVLRNPHIDEASGAFMDTAAIMRSLDLVITSDTAVAHLAGGLGIPVWVALSKVPDWRWLLDREDSPWYPTMRLFRQTRYGQWDDVFERIADALRALLTANDRS
jgi:tetratricopeptide (TPR) repeat protein